MNLYVGQSVEFWSHELVLAAAAVISIHLHTQQYLQVY